MYCVRCGRKIVPGNTRCKNCGEDATFAEYCGGFWGLVGKGDALADQLQEQQLKDELQAAQKGERKVKRQLNNLKIAFVVVLSLLVIWGGVQSIRLHSLNRKYKESKEVYSSLMTEHQKLNTDYVELNGEYNILKQKNEELTKELEDALSKHIEEVEENEEEDSLTPPPFQLINNILNNFKELHRGN